MRKSGWVRKTSKPKKQGHILEGSSDPRSRKLNSSSFKSPIGKSGALATGLSAGFTLRDTPVRNGKTMIIKKNDDLWYMTDIFNDRPLDPHLEWKPWACRRFISRFRFRSNFFFTFFISSSSISRIGLRRSSIPSSSSISFVKMTNVPKFIFNETETRSQETPAQRHFPKLPLSAKEDSSAVWKEKSLKVSKPISHSRRQMGFWPSIIRFGLSR